MKSKKIKKLMYLAAPVLWCGVLYFGSDNSLGTVLAKSVTTVTKTVAATMVEMPTVTQIETETQEPFTTLTAAITETEVPAQTASVTGIGKETLTQIPTEVVLTAETRGITIQTETQYASKDVSYYPTVTDTVIPVMGSTLQETSTIVNTQRISLVPTVTLGQQQTEVETQTLAAAKTAAATVTGIPTMVQTMTMTETVIDDGQKEEDKVIPQVVPSKAPAANEESEKKETPIATQETKKEDEASTISIWIPKTPEDRLRVSYVSREKVKVAAGSGPVDVKPALQGPECIKAFNRALKEGYTIGYTYNIKYKTDGKSKKPVYEIEKPVTVAMSIPKDMIKEGRVYEMICVSENGKTYNIPAKLDENNNLTFTTKYFYAYALTYKDAE